MRAIQRRWRDEAGAAAVEFSIVGLLAIVLCVGTVEFGRALHIANELSFAADRGARLVLLDPQVSDEQVVAEIRNNLGLANSDGLEILTSNGSPTARGLSVSLPLTLIIPTFGTAGFRVSVQRMVPTQ
ncbi:MAG: pilus assembly protein [Pararhodobacter sp.]|nr:pilus assembly protein [Pararhodobacter sp.]